MFVVIEGIDGAGTTTQTRLVGEALSAHVTREPSDLPIGRLIRQRLGDRSGDERAMALLFAADRLDHVHSEISPALQSGRIVVSDRYVMSSLAYQAELVDAQFVHFANQFALQPDLTFYLRITAEDALARRTARGGPEERYDALALQQRLVGRYDTLAAADPRCVTIDALLPVADITNAILACVHEAR